MHAIPMSLFSSERLGSHSLRRERLNSGPQHEFLWVCLFVCLWSHYTQSTKKYTLTTVTTGCHAPLWRAWQPCHLNSIMHRSTKRPGREGAATPAPNPRGRRRWSADGGDRWRKTGRRHARRDTREMDGWSLNRNRIGVSAERRGEKWWRKWRGGSGGGLPPSVGETSFTRASAALREREGLSGGPPLDWSRGIGSRSVPGRPPSIPGSTGPGTRTAVEGAIPPPSPLSEWGEGEREVGGAVGTGLGRRWERPLPSLAVKVEVEAGLVTPPPNPPGSARTPIPHRLGIQGGDLPNSERRSLRMVVLGIGTPSASGPMGSRGEPASPDFRIGGSADGGHGGGREKGGIVRGKSPPPSKTIRR